MRIRVYKDAGALAEAAVDEIAGWLRIDSTPTLGLAGGSTPRAVYEALREERLPWENVTAWMTDERHVHGNDPRSNTGMVREALFDHVPAKLHGVPWYEDPLAAAAAYRETLDEIIPRNPRGLQPGMVVLGVGEDGHTASLFPGTDALAETERSFVANWVPALKSWRLTATLRLLAAARRTLFLASGTHKAGIVQEVLESESDHPAAVLSHISRDTVWLLDREAAADLTDSLPRV